MPGKYADQQKHLRNNYARFAMDLRPEILEAFRAACRANGSTPTTELKKFIASYLEQFNAAHPETQPEAEQ